MKHEHGDKMNKTRWKRNFKNQTTGLTDYLKIKSWTNIQPPCQKQNPAITPGSSQRSMLGVIILSYSLALMLLRRVGFEPTTYGL
jgi:hypothetical protein